MGYGGRRLRVLFVLRGDFIGIQVSSGISTVRVNSFIGTITNLIVFTYIVYLRHVSIYLGERVGIKCGVVVC